MKWYVGNCSFNVKWEHIWALAQLPSSDMVTSNIDRSHFYMYAAYLNSRVRLSRLTYLITPDTINNTPDTDHRLHQIQDRNNTRYRPEMFF